MPYEYRVKDQYGLYFITSTVHQWVDVFTRKEYMNFFAEISSATASRDLKNGVDMHILERYGEKKTTQYKKI